MNTKPIFAPLLASMAEQAREQMKAHLRTLPDQSISFIPSDTNTDDPHFDIYDITDDLWTYDVAVGRKIAIGVSLICNRLHVDEIDGDSPDIKETYMRDFSEITMADELFLADLVLNGVEQPMVNIYTPAETQEIAQIAAIMADHRLNVYYDWHQEGYIEATHAFGKFAIEFFETHKDVNWEDYYETHKVDCWDDVIFNWIEERLISIGCISQSMDIKSFSIIATFRKGISHEPLIDFLNANKQLYQGMDIKPTLGYTEIRIISHYKAESIRAAYDRIFKECHIQGGDVRSEIEYFKK